MGTIRSNLDPFHRRTDQEIWAALDAVHLSESIKQNMPAKLETPIIENGRNFSLGQRQLFCIARAILFQSRILVLDGMISSSTCFTTFDIIRRCTDPITHFTSTLQRLQVLWISRQTC